MKLFFNRFILGLALLSLVSVSVSASTVTRSCKSRLEVKINYFSTVAYDTVTYKPKDKKKRIATTKWGFKRSSSSSGLIPSPSAARERACKASARARADNWTTAKIDDALDNVCEKYDYKGTLEILNIRSHAHSDDYSYNVNLNLESYRQFNYDEGIKYFNCEDGTLFDGSYDGDYGIYSVPLSWCNSMYPGCP